MFRFPVILILFGQLIYGSPFVEANEPLIFEMVKKGQVDALQTWLDTSKTSVNIVNAKGYSPLHVLIEHYAEFRPDWREKDPYKYRQSLEQYETYRACLRLLLDKGASAKQLTPEGWTALQYAVVKGKYDAFSELLDKVKGGDVRDADGNTLLHLSILINPEEPEPRFWQRLIDKMRSYDIHISTPNFAGQTPIAFYMSYPRCNPDAESAPKPGKLLGSGGTTQAPACPDNAMYHMLDVFRYHTSIMTPDFSGKTAIDYAKIHNGWAVSSLEGYMESYRRVQAEWEPHLKKFAQQAEENLRLIRAYEARKAAEAERGPSRSSGCRNYCSTCQGSGSGGEKARDVECPVCYGRGISDYSKSEISGYTKKYTYYSAQTCYKCRGSGSVRVYELHLCGACRGSGCGP